MSALGWSYPAGAENDPNAPWNQVDDDDIGDEDGVYESACGCKFATINRIREHERICKACRYDHDCDRADLLRKELKEDGGYIE